MPTTIDHIEAYFSSLKETFEFLIAHNEVSQANGLEGALAKTLVIASASFFEDFLTQAILDHVQKNATDETVVEFCRIAAIEQKYHSWFDWNGHTATKFFKLFGEAIKVKAADRIKSDPALASAISAFMFLGSQRNLIVHRNMLAYAFASTSDDIIAKAREALRFVNFVADELFN
jgi:hypothetical protein